MTRREVLSVLAAGPAALVTPAPSADELVLACPLPTKSEILTTYPVIVYRQNGTGWGPGTNEGFVGRVFRCKDFDGADRYHIQGSLPEMRKHGWSEEAFRLEVAGLIFEELPPPASDMVFTFEVNDLSTLHHEYKYVEV